jgi:alpha-glucosidase
LPIAADFSSVNVLSQSSDPNSMLSLYRRLIELRHTEAALSVGAYREILVTPEILVFERIYASRRLLVALNFSAIPQTIPCQQNVAVLLSTAPGQRWHDPAARVSLAAYEGVIAEVTG